MRAALARDLEREAQALTAEHTGEDRASGFDLIRPQPLLPRAGADLMHRSARDLQDQLRGHAAGQQEDQPIDAAFHLVELPLQRAPESRQRPLKEAPS